MIFIKTNINSINEIIQKIPNDLSTIEKARLAYLELGKVSFYNPIYKYMSDYEQYEYFHSSTTYKNPNIGICNAFTSQYLQILESLGIKCYERKINVDSFTHTYHSEAVFYDDNGIEHKASLANDLSRIQSHSKTKYFAADTLTQEQLREIDTKIGYIGPKHDYIDAYLDQCAKLINRYELSDSEKLPLLFHFLPKFFDPEKIGDDEQFKVLQFFNKRVLNSKNNSIYRTYNHNTREEDYYFKCFNPPKDGKGPYTVYLLFNKDTRSYEQVEYNELEKRQLIEGTQLYY